MCVVLPAVSADYVLALEAEMQNLKRKLRALEEQQQGGGEPVKTALPPADPRSGAHGSAEAAGESPWPPKPYALSQ